MRSLAFLGVAFCAGLAARSEDPAIPTHVRVIPSIISQPSPKYPYSMRYFGNQGDVMLDFTVDQEGNVRNIRVLQSSHADFEAPAVEALLQWKFTPGAVDGKPVATPMQLPIQFRLEDAHWAGKPWRIASGRASNKLPARLQYDVPPQPVLAVDPVYPFSLLRQDVTGSATVRFTVSETGQPVEISVTKATHPEFGASLKAAMASWRFSPAKKNGRPSPAMIEYNQDFNRGNREAGLGDSARRLLRELTARHSSIVDDAHGLDLPIKRRYAPPLELPPATRGRGEAARAEIKFIVDHAGHAQLPQVVSATDEEFGWAAMTCVARSQFTVPTKGGKAVDVFVIVPFVYEPPRTQPAAAPAKAGG